MRRQAKERDCGSAVPAAMPRLALQSFPQLTSSHGQRPFCSPQPLYGQPLRLLTTTSGAYGCCHHHASQSSYDVRSAHCPYLLQTPCPASKPSRYSYHSHRQAHNKNTGREISSGRPYCDGFRSNWLPWALRRQPLSQSRMSGRHPVPRGNGQETSQGYRRSWTRHIYRV